MGDNPHGLITLIDLESRNFRHAQREGLAEVLAVARRMIGLLLRLVIFARAGDER